MSRDNKIHNPAVRDGVGDSRVFATSVEQETVASYKVITFPGYELPKQYKALIYSKWLRSLRVGNDVFKLIDPEAYYRVHRNQIDWALAHDNCHVRLAVITDAPDVVLGFCVHRANILDYVHVLKIRIPVPTGIDITDFRRQGIGTRLIPAGIDTFTSLTRTWFAIWQKHYKKWKFNPWA